MSPIDVKQRQFLTDEPRTFLKCGVVESDPQIRAFCLLRQLYVLVGVNLLANQLKYYQPCLMSNLLLGWYYTGLIKLELPLIDVLCNNQLHTAVQYQHNTTEINTACCQSLEFLAPSIQEDRSLG